MGDLTSWSSINGNECPIIFYYEIVIPVLKNTLCFKNQSYNEQKSYLWIYVNPPTPWENVISNNGKYFLSDKCN